MELLRRLRLPAVSLATKLMVALSVLVAVVIAGSAMFLVQRERGERLGRLEERATRMADLLEQSLAHHVRTADRKAIQQQLDALVANRELAEATVTAGGYGTMATVAPRHVSDATDAVVRIRPITYRQLEGSLPQTIGEVRVVLTRADVEAAFARARWAMLAIAAAVGLILCAATGVLVRWFVRTPISRLEAMVDRLAAGDLDARCPVDSADELGRLAERVNVMADRLRESTAHLRESETRFGTFVDHATDAFFLHDDQLTVIDVNRQACESLGYSRAELTGMHPRDFDVGLDAASVADLAERVRAGETITFESLHRRKDGTVFPVEVRAHRFPQGQHRFRYSLVRDITERKRAEAELRASEERFRTLVQFSFDVYWETDAQHRFMRQEFAESLADAPAPDSEIGKTRWEVPHLEPDEEAWRQHRATLDAHLPFRDFELARPMPDGGKRWVSVSGLPMFDSTGRFLGYRGVGRHITERKRVEAELRARQELLDLAQKAARAVAFDWYIGARESENRWSPELEAMYGLDPGTFDRTYQGWKQLIHPEDWPAVQIAINRANESGDVAAEYRVIHNDGTVHWLRAKGRMFFDAKGQPERMVGFMIDVTDWRHAEEALRASEARFRTFVDHATDGLFLHDDDLTVIDVNRHACEALGYSRDELIGMHPRQFDAGLDERTLADLAERVRAGETVTFETRHRRKDGREFPVEVRARQFHQGAGRLGLSLVRDISDRKRAEEERREHLWFLESMDRINRAIQGTNDLEKMMSDVLDAVLDVLACDRAWLIHPCDPAAPSWSPTMERTRPGFPGAFTAGAEFPVDADVAALFAAARASDRVVHFRRGSGRDAPAVAERFEIRSQIAMAVHPKTDEQPYLFGIQQCSHARVWTAPEQRLFQEIGRRLADALTTVLIFRSLRQSERMLEDAQRLAHVGYWDRDLVAHRVTLSDETYRIFGFEPADRVTDLAVWHERWQALIHPEDRPAVLAAVTAALGGGPRYDVEFRIVRNNGEVRVVHSQGDVIRDVSGQPSRMFGTQQDVTELRQAENELRASEARFRTFADHATDAFFRLDDRSTVIDVNRHACESLGYTREELIGMHLGHFDAGLDASSLAQIIHRISAGDTVTFETRHRRKDGRVFPVEIRARQFEQGGRRFRLSLVRDITERKRAEEERERLRQLEADLAHINRVSLLGELTASIAHEVNQPLAGVVSNGSACLRWLAGDVPNLDEAREAARRIVRDGKRAGDVIARVRAMTRRAATPTERVDLNQTIQEVLALVGDEAQRTNAMIRTQFADDLAPIAGDRVQLQQVMLNLVMNAIEAMSTVGARAREVVITTRNVDAEHVQVTVEDSGSGVDPDAVERMFEPFYTTKASGMGMGLSVSRSIIQSHGGRLWATAKDGPGTVFHFVLPQYPEPPHAGTDRS